MELEHLKPLVKKLEGELELHKMLRQQDLDRHSAEAHRALQEAKRQEGLLRAEKEKRCAEAGQVQDSLFSGMTQDEALQKANTDALKAAERRKNGWLAVGLFSLLGVLVGAAMFVLWQMGIVHRVFWCALGILPMLWGIWLGSRNRREEELLLGGMAQPSRGISWPGRPPTGCHAGGGGCGAPGGGSPGHRRHPPGGGAALLDALVQSGGRPDAKPELLAAPIHTRGGDEARLEEDSGGICPPGRATWLWP